MDTQSDARRFTANRYNDSVRIALTDAFAVASCGLRSAPLRERPQNARDLRRVGGRTRSLVAV